MRRIAAVVVATITMLAVFVSTASGAGAHTSLLNSQPLDGAVLEEPPREAVLEFARAVDPQFVSTVLLRADGRRYEDPVRTTPDRPDSTVIRFRLPDLASATYGLQWETIGPDGHRVAGEVVFSVADSARDTPETPRGRSSAEGASPRLTDQATGPSDIATDRREDRRDQLLDNARRAARLLWYAGLVLAAGALYVSLWLQRHDFPSPGETERLGAVAATAGRHGARVATLGATAMWATTVAVLVDSSSGTPVLTAVRVALGSRTAIVEVAVVVVLLTLVGFGRAVRTRPWRGASGLVAAVVVHSSGGHATEATSIVGWLGRTSLAAAHSLAAALWLGPLLIVAIWVALDRPKASMEPSALVRRLLHTYGRVALAAFVAVLATGLAQLWARTGLYFNLDAYWAMLLLKGSLIVVVAVPIGWHHHHQFVRRRPLARRPRVRRLGLSVKAEAGAGLLIASLGMLLAGMSPTAPVARAVGDAAAGPVASPSSEDCAELVVGKPGCYREHFAEVALHGSVADALHAIDEARRDDPYVAEQCHQITHDLGNDAARVLGLAEALSNDGSLCASGFYHGVIEIRLDGVADDDLPHALERLCERVAQRRYSGPHFSCIHGVGHGLMLRNGLDLDGALPLCDLYKDAWEQQSCLGGVFMENVVGIQEGQGKGAFRDSDPLYPCSEVRNDQKAACYSIHTSYLLSRTNFDFQAVFELCEQAEPGFIDACYQSMGRDISGIALLDAQAVIDGCQAGAARWRRSCYIGAALNAVNTESGLDTAIALCDLVPARDRAPCRRAAETLADGL